LPPEILTRRLRLRAATLADVDALHAVLSDERATAYWSTPPHRDREQTLAWVAAMIAIPPDAGEDFVVEAAGRVIGKAGLYRFPEIGYILHPDAWGRGYAAEACGAVLERAFRVHGLPAVIADVDPRNAASLKLLGRLGFRETGRRTRTWFIAGQWCDRVDLRLEASDWRALQGCPTAPS
jgi:RimJ/RimL family protein N-acetyltransferase